VVFCQPDLTRRQRYFGQKGVLMDIVRTSWQKPVPGATNELMNDHA
jgi:hypothetical protein